MFLVKELASLRDSTTLEETNQLQYWPRKSQKDNIEISANVDNASTIRLTSYDFNPSSRNGKQYTYASFDERRNWRYKRGQIYDMALQTDMSGNSRLMGRYATGLLFDRVSLRYYSDGQIREIKKTFLRNPLSALRKPSGVPPQTK